MVGDEFNMVCARSLVTSTMSNIPQYRAGTAPIIGVPQEVIPTGIGEKEAQDFERMISVCSFF